MPSTWCSKKWYQRSGESVQGAVNNVPVFSVDLATGKVANQKQSGPAGCLRH